MTATLAEVIGWTMLGIAGNNTTILSILLLVLFAYLMFVFRIPASFAFVSGLVLFFVLQTYNPLFQTLELLLIGFVGIGLIALLLKNTRG